MFGMALMVFEGEAGFTAGFFFFAFVATGWAALAGEARVAMPGRLL